MLKTPTLVRLYSTILLILHASAGFSDTRIYTKPDILLGGQTFTLNIVYQHNSNCGNQLTHHIYTNNFDVTVDVKRDLTQPCQEEFILGMSKTFSTLLGPLERGTYEITIKHPDGLIDKSYVLLVDRPRKYIINNHETPEKNQLVSGIGLIRGWACEWFTKNHYVQYQIDNEPKQDIPYGSERSDTSTRCSFPRSKDFPNGYGAVVNWNLYPPGEHRITIWIDGKEQSSRIFYIADYKQEFLVGIQHDVSITDFPETGITSHLKWSQANQNFIIVDTVNNEQD